MVQEGKLNYTTSINTDGSTVASEVQAYKLTSEQVENVFRTSIQEGLKQARSEELLKSYGENVLGDDQKINLSKIILHQSCNAMILVLIISMAITFGIKDWISGGVIAFVVFINVAIGSFEEFKASKTMNSLKSLSSPTAKILRDGELRTIPTKYVVIGDIVNVVVGDTIPADLRLVDTSNFETDEALLTGESLPIAKDSEIVYENDEPVGDRLNIAYSSSIVTKGRATGIVIKTGLDTEIGEIAKSLKKTKRSLRSKDDETSISKHLTMLIKDGVGSFLGTTVGTPLHKKLSKLAIFLFAVAVIFAIIVMASQKFKVTNEVAIYAICVAVSMIPSSLVVVLTITMSVGAKIMSKKNVIIRKMDSLEALGSVTDICSDKTGTLTQGKMIVKSIWIPSVGTINVSNSSEALNPTIGKMKLLKGSPLDNPVQFDADESDLKTNEIYQTWLRCATLANIATVFQNEQGEWKAHGDPTETAIQVFIQRNSMHKDLLTKGENAQYTHLHELPFDSSVKKMSVIYSDKSDNEQNHVFTKGAVERLIRSCKNWYVDEGLSDMNSNAISTIEQNMNKLSEDGLRVLAFATKKISKSEQNLNDREALESGLTFLGLVGIYDPPRLETLGAVKKCHKAGIDVHMLTGDHPGTAKAIAQQVEILPYNLNQYSEEVVRAMVMTAQQFDDLTDDQIDKLPVLPLVIARCSPKTKVRMIEALNRRGRFVAMTGDGVNDSPSLKKADVGIAMGIAGSDVAKDASDIVLSDDNFASIINGIEEGRRMNTNIQKFVLQLLAENVAQALYLMIGLVFKDSDGLSVFPLSPVEVLWIIVVTSCFPAMGLGVEAAEPDIMKKHPKSAKESVFSWEMLADLFVYGVWMAICCLCCFILVIYPIGDGQFGQLCNKDYSEECRYVFRSRSASFATMTWCALILAWEVIDMRRSLFNMKPNSIYPHTQVFRDLWGNQFLFWSVIGGFISCFPVVYIPVINKKVFLHGPIGQEWGIAVGLSIVFWIGCEVYKACKRVYFKKQELKRQPTEQTEKLSAFDRYISFSRETTLV